jgi:signal transduction histidine kinase/FixJ family two-component response regulator
MRNSKYHLKAIIRKILAAFVLVSIAIFLALSIAKFSFRELMGTVHELSAPNEKLTLLNSVFEEITTLDQLQRAEAIQNPNKPYQSFLEQSSTLNKMIDSLKTFGWDKAQLQKLQQMKQILEARNKLFFSYLKVKAGLLDNREFSVQLDTLAAILQNDQLSIDSTLITTHTKTTTTYLPDTTPLKKSEKRSLLKKLFTKRKSIVAVDTPHIKVQQEYSVDIDTLAVARQNNALIAIEKIMREMESDQRLQRRKLQGQELELINANSLFINQLLGILHQVEKEELLQMEYNNQHAVKVMNQSISRTNLLMLVFFIAAAILVYLILIDISRSNYYKEQLEKAKDEAVQLSQIKQRFLANMSHELRTPLQSIIGFAEQLKQKNNYEEVEAIYSSSEHLLQIVNEVLDYSRISSGNFTLAREKFRLLRMVKEVEASMRVQADLKKLTFILDFEKAGDFLLTGDPFRLRQILYNVIGNAIKFTHHGFVKLAVKTIDEGEEVRCVFEVTDTGIGIEREDFEKIFNQFEQANTTISKHYGGTGLGLTIVKSLVDAQQGSLQLSSEPGKGSSFKIELSFEKPPVPVIAKPVDVSLKAPSFRGKVLVIDDDSLITRLCELILNKHGINFLTFNQPTVLLSEHPDPAVTHIFLDIRMPEINGIELCRSLRKKYKDHVRFIALTAHVLPEERKGLLEEGFDDVLAKPFHEGELLSCLGFVLATESIDMEEQPDLSALREMTMGDEAVFQSIISQFVDETLDDLTQIREQSVIENGAAIREIVHKMSGRFAQLGMTSLAQKLHQLEKQLVAGNSYSTVAKDIDELSRKVSDAVRQIRLMTLMGSNPKAQIPNPK